MVSYNKFQDFVEQQLIGTHDWDANTFKIYLSDATPSTSADAVKADLAEIASGGGSTAGGNATTISVSESSGTAKVVGTDPTTWTGSGGGIAQFRYVALYNDSSASDNLVAWWDYASEVNVAAGETFTVDLDGTAGIFQLS